MFRAATIAALLASAVVATHARAQSAARDATLVAEVRALSARALDPTQPDIPLEQWLKQTIGRENTFEWSVGGCDLKATSDDLSNHPLCVEIRTRRRGALGLRLHVLVGTYGAGAVGTPALARQSFVWRWCTRCSGEVARNECTAVGIASLSELAASAGALRANKRCR